MTDRVGQQLGNYRLLHPLGQGGFADVYLGEHVYLKTLAAVKVLQVRLTNESLEGFLSEARTIGGLRHPHIVRVLDFGVDSSTPFLVMDHAPHGTLRQRYSSGTRLPLSSIVLYVQQVASALQYAHDNRLIHRDVKPENMLLGPDNEVLLSDFGIAVVAQSTRYGSAQEVAGTIAYMAPEQISGKPHPASDQYALGVVVYEWLSGDRPFHGSFAEVASQHMLAPPASLREKVPTIPPDVERVVMVALEKDLHRRFGNVQAFANALEQASLTEMPSSGYSSTFILPTSAAASNITPSLTQPVEAPSTIPTLLPSIQSQSPATRRISRRAMIIGLAGLAVASGGIAAWVHNQEGPVHSQASGPAPATTNNSNKTPESTSTNTTPASTATPAPSPTSGAAAPLPLIYRGHSDQVYTVAWSPNGFHIASGGLGDIIQIWDANTGDKYLTYQGHTAKVYSVTWSPDSTSLASGHYDATVRVWNASTGNLHFIYRGHPSSYQGGPNWINSVVWSPDGSYIASGSHDSTVHICDATHGDMLLIYYGHSGYVNTVAWSPDSTRIASGGKDTTVQIWNATSGDLLLKYRGHTSDVEGVAWSPDGKYIVSGGVDGTVQLWDATNGNILFTYRGHYKTVNTVGWSANAAYIASGGYDTTVQIWNATNGNNLVVYHGHTDFVQGLAWSPDSTRVASASNDATVQICSAI